MGSSILNVPLNNRKSLIATTKLQNCSATIFKLLIFIFFYTQQTTSVKNLCATTIEVKTETIILIFS